eukprot:1884685-Rhodomonas_salina.2
MSHVCILHTRRPVSENLKPGSGDQVGDAGHECQRQGHGRARWARACDLRGHVRGWQQREGDVSLRSALPPNPAARRARQAS